MKPSTEAIDKLYLELSQFTQAKTARERNLEHHLSQMISAGCEALNCMGATSDEKVKAAVQVERVKYNARMNEAYTYLGRQPVNPDLDKNDDSY
jgi:hypothetical protein